MIQALVCVALLVLALLPAPAQAGEATVVGVEPLQGSDGTWTFSVSIAHADTGWEHYSNAFTIELPSGEVLGTRTLHHPHVNEQPFTRSLNGVAVPDDVTEVLVRAHDSVHGPGTPVTVQLR